MFAQSRFGQRARVLRGMGASIQRLRALRGHGTVGGVRGLGDSPLDALPYVMMGPAAYPLYQAQRQIGDITGRVVATFQNVGDAIASTNRAILQQLDSIARASNDVASRLNSGLDVASGDVQALLQFFMGFVWDDANKKFSFSPDILNTTIANLEARQAALVVSANNEIAYLLKTGTVEASKTAATAGTHKLLKGVDGDGLLVPTDTESDYSTAAGTEWRSLENLGFRAYGEQTYIKIAAVLLANPAYTFTTPSGGETAEQYRGRVAESQANIYTARHIYEVNKKQMQLNRDAIKRLDGIKTTLKGFETSFQNTPAGRMVKSLTDAQSRLQDLATFIDPNPATVDGQNKSVPYRLQKFVREEILNKLFDSKGNLVAVAQLSDNIQNALTKSLKPISDALQVAITPTPNIVGFRDWVQGLTISSTDIKNRPYPVVIALILKNTSRDFQMGKGDVQIQGTGLAGDSVTEQISYNFEPKGVIGYTQSFSGQVLFGKITGIVIKQEATPVQIGFGEAGASSLVHLDAVAMSALESVRKGIDTFASSVEAAFANVNGAVGLVQLYTRNIGDTSALMEPSLAQIQETLNSLHKLLWTPNSNLDQLKQMRAADSMAQNLASLAEWLTNAQRQVGTELETFIARAGKNMDIMDQFAARSMEHYAFVEEQWNKATAPFRAVGGGLPSSQKINIPLPGGGTVSFGALNIPEPPGFARPDYSDLSLPVYVSPRDIRAERAQKAAREAEQFRQRVAQTQEARSEMGPGGGGAVALPPPGAFIPIVTEPGSGQTTGGSSLVVARGLGMRGLEV